MTKDIDDYNAKDIYDLFCLLYEEKHRSEYTGAGFIGNELHVIKKAVLEHGSSQIVCATLNCILSNDRTVNVPYFIAGLKHYLVSYNPYIYWAVKRYGDDEIMMLWKKFLFLDAVWLHTAAQRKNYKVVFSDLRDWAYEKTNRKKRSSNTKKTTNRNKTR